MEFGNKIQVYDAQFPGNILVLGKAASGKTYFIQKLAKNGFFWRYCPSLLDIGCSHIFSVFFVPYWVF